MSAHPLIDIIGGGPAGLLTAIALARKGIPSRIFEAKPSWPIDKVCGEGLMPNGVKILKELGITEDLKRNKYNFFDGVDYFEKEKHWLSGHFNGDHGLAIRRTELSRVLYESAKKEKLIQLLPDHRLRNIKLQRKMKILSFRNKNDIESEFLLACDGLHSTVRKVLTPLSSKPKLKERRMGARFHLPYSIPGNRVQVHWSKGVEMYLTPSGDQTEVAFLWYQEQFPHHWKEVFKQEFKKIIPPEDYPERIEAWGTFGEKLKSPIYDSTTVFLGDAYYFLDGITGEGLSLAFESGMALAECLAHEGSLKNYVKKLKPVYFRYTVLTKLALFFARHPKIRRLTFPFFPNRLFNRLISP